MILRDERRQVADCLGSLTDALPPGIAAPSGIDVVRIRATVFVISSALAAIGAIIYSSKVGSVSPSSGGGNTLLFAVGGAVIGGTSLFGGRGRVSNAVIGGADR